MKNVRSRTTTEIEIEALDKFMNNGNEELKREFKEIEGLKFVKKINIENNGIRVNIGDVSIKVVGYKGEGGDMIDVPIGEIEFFITPEKIYVDNLKRKTIWLNKVDTKELIHPHVLWGDPSTVCWGSERWGIMSNLLGEFKLKDLVYMLNLWAKSYTPNDKYVAIGYWTGELGKNPNEPVDGAGVFNIAERNDETENIERFNVVNRVMVNRGALNDDF